MRVESVPEILGRLATGDDHLPRLTVAPSRRALSDRRNAAQQFFGNGFRLECAAACTPTEQFLDGGKINCTHMT
jgi:hypothetical protein